MADNETIADIIAEIRALSNPISDGIIAINGRRIADRLEAACKRELSNFNPKCDWSVQEALGFANTLANHGWTQEANSDAASSCIYSLCRLLKERGDYAKLREALETLLNLAYEVQDANSEYGPKTSVSAQFIIDVAKSALDATEKEGGDDGK